MTTIAVYNDMIAQGWRGEGVVMCALNDGALADFNPTGNTSIGGTVNVANVMIPAGVTVTVDSDLALNATGTVTIAGTLAGDCKAVGVIASGQLHVSGSIDNHCAALPEGAPPTLTLVGYGGYQFNGGGTRRARRATCSSPTTRRCRKARPHRAGSSRRRPRGTRVLLPPRLTTTACRPITTGYRGRQARAMAPTAARPAATARRDACGR